MYLDVIYVVRYRDFILIWHALEYWKIILFQILQCTVLTTTKKITIERKYSPNIDPPLSIQFLTTQLHQSDVKFVRNEIHLLSIHASGYKCDKDVWIIIDRQN